jgi:hypothetical protein
MIVLEALVKLVWWPAQLCTHNKHKRRASKFINDMQYHSFPFLCVCSYPRTNSTDRLQLLRHIGATIMKEVSLFQAIYHNMCKDA